MIFIAMFFDWQQKKEECLIFSRLHTNVATYTRRWLQRIHIDTKLLNWKRAPWLDVINIELDLWYIFVLVLAQKTMIWHLYKINKAFTSSYLYSFLIKKVLVIEFMTVKVLLNLKSTQKCQHKEIEHLVSEHVETLSKHSAINIASCNKYLYGTLPTAIWKILSQFLMFCNLFQEPLDERSNSKIWETRKIFANIPQGNLQ